MREKRSTLYTLTPVRSLQNERVCIYEGESRICRLFFCGLIHLRSYSFAVLFIFGEEQTADPEEDHPQECKDEKQQHKAREP